MRAATAMHSIGQACAAMATPGPRLAPVSALPVRAPSNDGE